jgi:hypothetical protein
LGSQVAMHTQILAFIGTAALVVPGCAAANAPSPGSHDSHSSLHQERCPVGENLSALITRLMDRGCSKEVSRGFAASFVRVASQRWDPQSVMRRRDPTARWLGGMALRSLLRVSLNRAGIVTAVSMEETFRRNDSVVRAMSLEADSVADALDSHAVEAFAVGTLVSPVPACSQGLDDLGFRLALCLQVQRASGAIGSSRAADRVSGETAAG